MEVLSHTCLHSRPAMVRALSRAGQFAHLPTSVIADTLDELYDPTIRKRIRGEKIEAYAQNAVSWDLFEASQAGILTEPVFKASAAMWVAENAGVTCCLCLDVDYERAPLLHERFGVFFCPTFLRTGDPPRPSACGPLPFCLACGRALSNWTWREGGIHWSNEAPDEIMFAAAAWLVTNRTFRERVQDNAHRISELRFDPRRVQAWGKRRVKSRTRTCERCGGKRSIRAKVCRECFREEAPAAAQARWDQRRVA